MYLAIATGMLGAMMFGMDQGNFGQVQTFSNFEQEWCVNVGHFASDIADCDTNNIGWFGSSSFLSWGGFLPWAGSMITFGAAAGAMAIGPIVANTFGRRCGISVGGAITFGACMFSSYLSFHSIVVMLIARFMTGFGVGVCAFALPLYNAEVATPGVRGACGSLFQFFVVFGVLVANILTAKSGNSKGTLVPDLPWQIGMMLPGFAGLVVSVVVWFLPESPRWIMAKNGYEAGVDTLKKIRVGDVTEEASGIQDALKAEADISSVAWKELFARGHLRKRVFVASGLQVAQQFTGVNAIYFYQGQIFAAVGQPWDGISGILLWLLGQMIGVCIGIMLIDSPHGGRKPQLLAATLLTAPALVLAALGIQFSWPGILTMIFFCIYGFSFQVGWGIVPWLYPAELFSMAEKEKAVSLAVFLQYASNGVVTLASPKLMHGAHGVSITCYFFAACNSVILWFVLACVKETKGLKIEDVPELFGAKKPELLASA